MDMTAFTTAISSVGFPIAMCVALMWFNRELVNSHKEETKDFTDALNNNTLVLQKLCDRMDKGDN